MDAEILRELVQIKWWIAALVVGVLSLAVLRTLIDVKRSGGPREVLRRSFASRAKSLLESSDSKQLLALAEERLRATPGDAYAHWYHAQAAHRLGDVAAAVESIRRVGDLQPEWRETYVEPFMRALGAELAKPQSSPPSVESGPSRPH